MKKTILFAVFLIFFGTLKAQSSAAEAKATYLLAEEQFNNTHALLFLLLPRNDNT